jgi:hypothetical protein
VRVTIVDETVAAFPNKQSCNSIQTLFTSEIFLSRSMFGAMSILSNLISKLFRHAPKCTATGEAPAPPEAQVVPPVTYSPSTPAPPKLDAAAVLDDLAAKNPEKLEWRKSIIDLLKLLEMDSSLAARKELATELQYPYDQNDSAKMNVWLHKEVLMKFEENNCKVPAELLS